MLETMKRTIIAGITLFFATNIFAADVELLHANEWSVPKQTSTLLAMPAIHKSMKKCK